MNVFLVGETRFVEDPVFGREALMAHLGVPDWKSDAFTDAEELCEVMGRLCYMSFDPSLNKNITRVRQGNEAYLANILRVNHGSVLEHSQLNFVFCGVSRVLTHELVRHRVGVAVSQTSMRYVRLDDLSVHVPLWIEENEAARTIYYRAVEQAEENIAALTEALGLDKAVSFRQKKDLTSAIRRLAPDGTATNIGWSCNFRTLRYCIERRAAVDAEEEIRELFHRVFRIVQARYPNLFQDARIVGEKDGIPAVAFGEAPAPGDRDGEPAVLFGDTLPS